MKIIIIIIIVIIVLGIAIAIFVWLFSPTGPAVAGLCGLVKRSVRKDYCSGTCAPPGAVCIAATTRSWGYFLGKQAATCACAYIILPTGKLWDGTAQGEGGVTLVGPDSSSLPGGTEIIFIDEGKCKEMCLSIKVALDAAGQPVMDDNRVKRIIAGVNVIWGCEKDGQCCIRFTISEIKPVAIKGYIDPFDGSSTFDDTLNIARSQTCYNLYFVDGMVDQYPGATRVGASNDGSMVRTQNYPNDDTIISITAHELGHGLGLANTGGGTDDTGVIHHSNHAKNLMEPGANLQKELNKFQCLKARMSPLLKDTPADCIGKPGEP